MEKTILGRTNLEVSVAGLGSGGHSRLGQSYGTTKQSSDSIVKRAYELGINFFDSAEGYGTEQFIGDGLKEFTRDSYVLSTKFSYLSWSHMRKPANKDFMTKPELLENSVDSSLKKLNTDYIDVYNIHGVMPTYYEFAKELYYPELEKMQKKGKIRYIGVTEMFNADPSHMMAKQALTDDLFDVIMLGFNMVNFSAAKEILPLTRKNNVGTLDMFAVRTALSRPEKLIELVRTLINDGLVDREIIDINNPLGFITNSKAADSIVEAAYRFCRHFDGIDVVLSGTGNINHLEENIKSLQKQPLPKDISKKIIDIFGKVDNVSCE